MKNEYFSRLEYDPSDKGRTIKDLDRSIDMDKFWRLLEERAPDKTILGLHTKLSKKKVGMLKRRFHDGWSHNEIAEEYGCTSGNVSAMNIRSLSGLRSMLYFQEFLELRDNLIDYCKF
jgi:hypothetical protein